MITQYLRPKTLQEAFELLSHADVHPLGGGTVLSRPTGESFTVVDLQALGLDHLSKSGDKLEIGATTSLQSLLESAYIPEALKTALLLETPLNLRNLATVAGTLITCDGRSPFAVVMLALDAKLTFMPGNEQITLGNFLPIRIRVEGVSPISSIPPHKLITKIEIPLNTRLAFETVARTPADKPIVCASLAQWPSGRNRLALGGYGHSPALAVDGNAPNDLEASARNAFAEAGDAWASKEYRQEIAAVLAKRCLEK
jgi:CO/xanthine dehydrogenase FAD-binding subunit